jgi:hypothetical protein
MLGISDFYHMGRFAAKMRIVPFFIGFIYDPHNWQVFSKPVLPVYNRSQENSQDIQP